MRQRFATHGRTVKISATSITKLIKNDDTQGEYRQSNDVQWASKACEPINGIFSKLGRLASEEVILQLIGQKCLPVLLYGLEVFSLSKRHMQSLDFTVNRVLMKLFKSPNIDIINVCRDMFNFRLPSELLAYRSEKFLFNVANDVCLR